jgi:hypothetical protein
MEQIRTYLATRTRYWTVGDLARLGAAAIVIAVVPGALMVWIAWRFLRPRLIRSTSS